MTYVPFHELKHRRLRVRFSVVLRREGGSLSMTVPRYIVKQWQLKRGDRLVIRSNDEGVLLLPRYQLPYRRRLYALVRRWPATEDIDGVVNDPADDIEPIPDA